jgi:hypothetical protein
MAAVKHRNRHRWTPQARCSHAGLVTIVDSGGTVIGTLGGGQ